MDIEILVTSSDLHSGSTLSVFPPEYTTLDGEMTLKSNRIQSWLFDSWVSGWEKVLNYIGSDEWAYAFVGDAVEGLHHKREQLALTDLNDQLILCDQLLRPYVTKASKRFFVRGTATHTGNSEEIKIAEHLNFEQHPDTGQFASDRWKLSFKNYPIVLRHHFSVTSRSYLRASALGIELGNEQLAAVKRGYSPPKGLISAHRHMFDYYTDGMNFTAVMGPWQMTTRHGHKKWSPMVPEPTICVFDWRGLPHGSAPHMEVFKFTPKEESEIIV